jgi:hypothetical protein
MIDKIIMLKKPLKYELYNKFAQFITFKVFGI